MCSLFDSANLERIKNSLHNYIHTQKKNISDGKGNSYFVNTWHFSHFLKHISLSYDNILNIHVND